MNFLTKNGSEDGGYKPAPQVRSKLGDDSAFMQSFSVSRLRYWAQGVYDAVADAQPTLAQCVRTYPADKIASLLSAHTASMLADIGETEYFDERSVYIVANGIAANEKARTLTMASVLKFFYDMRLGAIRIFGRVNVRSLLEAFNTYANEQVRIEGNIRAKIQKDNEHNSDEQHAANSISWEKYCKLHNIDADVSLQAYIVSSVSNK